jgi:hypothetical protein
MQDLQGFPAEADFVAVLQPAIRREIVCRQAIASSLLGQAPHKVFVAAVWSFEACPGRCRETRRSAGMVRVGVSHKHELETQLLPLKEALDPIEVAAGINHRGGMRDRAPQDRAVLFRAGDRHRVELHKLLRQR